MNGVIEGLMFYAVKQAFWSSGKEIYTADKVNREYNTDFIYAHKEELALRVECVRQSDSLGG